MATEMQGDLIDAFETRQPANALFCHQDFLEKLAVHGHDSIGKRVTFLLQRLAVDASRLHYKVTRGENRGWRRSRLGGNQGSHFYAWWAPKGAQPLKDAEGFSGAPEGAIILRDIRHHDDHAPLAPQSFDDHYLPLTVRDLRGEEYAPAPWTQPQARFAAGRQMVRVLKGHPGSGKTTALWNAADSTGAERVLYVTYSRDLAALARGYFDRYCSAHKNFRVVTFPNLIRELLEVSTPAVSEQESRQRFARDVAPFARFLGAWSGSHTALYDELHAHLVGDALPLAIGRFAASKQPRVPDESYRERRIRFLGTPATASALEAASRLERLESSTLAERYFPELALAWQAAERLRAAAAKFTPSGIAPALYAFDCMAVDECQDLTPIEAFVVAQLATLANRGRKGSVPLLLAGDEAQTIRPTDFEWGWLSDLLHFQVGTPAEYKLGANLRSPRRIAELVNRVWDLYSWIQKQERPSGTGYAEIADDATDQILYGTAVPGAELDALLVALSSREGLALISLEEAVPAYVPEAVRPAVLTVSEAKGLDFHSVCVLDAGRHLDRIMRERERVRADSDIEGLRKRLAIDQLRVALSRATERLLWLDLSPSDRIVRNSVSFLNGGQPAVGVAACVPAALLKTLEEDQLDPEERVQRCQMDARQYLQVRPEMAWSRAQQAVTLLGPPGSLAAVADQATRDTAYLTLAEICFCLGMRNSHLPAELGRPDLFAEARDAAVNARRPGLADIVAAIGRVHRAPFQERLNPLAELAQTLPRQKKEMEPWILIEVGEQSKAWLDQMESAVAMGQNAAALAKILPPFFEALAVPDCAARTGRLQQRVIQMLLKEKQFAGALAVLRGLPQRQAGLEAACHEGLGDFRAAAECHLSNGDVKEALQCYRSVPDLEAALKLVREIGTHPAAESLEWIGKLQELIAQRPGNFTKVVTPAEKKILEQMLEQSLGVRRRKPGEPKPAAKKRSQPKAAARKPAAPRKRTPRQIAPESEWF
jgi:hypothetical protein